MSSIDDNFKVECLNDDLIYKTCLNLYYRIELHDNMVLLHRDATKVRKSMDNTVDFPEDLNSLREDTSWSIFQINNANNYNIFRADRAQECDAQRLLEQAPARADNFFVVPSIIETI